MSMWVEERRHRILGVLRQRGRIEVEALAEELAVSRETVRRDLLRMESEGLVRRIHGGAVAAAPATEKPFQQRVAAQAEEKRRIAAAAARLIHPGQSCFIDAGTTTAAFALALARVQDVTVITNSLDVATTLRNADATADVLLLGGRPGADVPATYGELTLEQIGRFWTDLAVISPVGVAPAAGASYFHLAEAEVARTMVSRASETIVLADHTKLGVVSRVGVCGCADIGKLVTDDASQEDAFRAAGLACVIRA